MLEKNAIEPVPWQEAQTGFYSTFFLVPKKSGGLRPVINLRPLNRYLKRQHFKMDSLSTVLNLVQQGDWAISLDLIDAYMHIPIFKSHRKFLRFCIQGKVWQFTCLCFGPTIAPRAFTKVVSVVAAHLRMQNVRLAVYLDDWFLVNQLRNMLIADKKRALNLLVDLGFMINLKKSELQPSQSVVYIGAHFLLDKGLVCPTQERVFKIREACMLVKQFPTAQNYLHLLGLLASCIELVPNARLFMRPIQLHLLHFWRPATMDLKTIVPFNSHIQEHLRFWLKEENLLSGKTFCTQTSSKVVTTDASKYGYRGHFENQLFQGTWSMQEAKMHINWLELKAIYLTVKTFSSPAERSLCVDTHRQYNLRSIYPQRGRDKIPSTMLSSVGAMASSKSQQHSVESSSFSRTSKCPGRQIESSQNKGNGVVIERCCSEQTIQDVGVPLDRSVRFRRKSEGSGILHMVSQSTGSDNRRIINCLGEHGSVCISSDLSHTESASAHEEISLSNNLDSSTMAKEELVYQSPSA